MQKEARTLWAVAKVVDLTIGRDIYGVFVDMHAANGIRGVACIKEGEKMFIVEVEWMEANIIEVEVLENEIETFGKLD